MLMEEEWRDVVGFEDSYEVSNLGKVRSKARTIIYENGKVVHRKSRVKKPTIDGNSYPRVGLQVRGKLTMKMIHRLVAEAFIPNPKNLPIVNHKDEDKTNSNASNLEWCDNSYNVSYSNKGIDRKSTKASNSGIVLKLTLLGVEVARYNGLTEACRVNGYSRGKLDKIVNSTTSRVYDGFIWVYLA